MAVHHRELSLSTRGHAAMIDITAAVQDAVSEVGLTEGTATIFVPGSTGGVTTIEYEDGALADFTSMFDSLAPADAHYSHNARWGDGNGHSHVRAALLGPSLSVPIAAGRLLTGTWQQIVFVDFDNRPRDRRLVLTLMGD